MTEVSPPRELPFKAWRLMPSFKPAEVELVEKRDSFSKTYYIDAKGKWFSESELFLSRDAVVAHARERIAQQQADLDTQLANLNKRRAAVEKHA